MIARSFLHLSGTKQNRVCIQIQNKNSNSHDMNALTVGTDYFTLLSTILLIQCL